MQAVLCYFVCLHKNVKEQGTYATVYKYYHNFSTNKQNLDEQTNEQGKSALYEGLV
jgi:hypothetical protein